LALRDVNAEIVDYAVAQDSPLAGRTVEELRLPEGAVVALVSRDGTLIAPRGATRLRPGDHLFVVSQTSARSGVDRALGNQGQ
jgi:potassium/hydrogen antiporter